MVAALCLTKPMKIFFLGRNEWYGKVTTTTKQYKIGRGNTYYWAKKRCILSCRPYLDDKEVKVPSKSDVPEDINMGTKTEFRVKVVEHKE